MRVKRDFPEMIEFDIVALAIKIPLDFTQEVW
jgi:hypothetical protein